MDHSTLNSMGDFSYDELEFEHVDEFAVEYEFFLMDDEPEYDMFDFDDACFIDHTTNVASTCDTSVVPLDMKLLLTPLSIDFWIMMSIYL